MKSDPESDLDFVMGGSGGRLIATREEAERLVREALPISIRRGLEDQLGQEYPEYKAFLRRRANRCLELIGNDVEGDEIDRIMAAEGFNDEEWEPKRWRREHGETSPRTPADELP